MSKKEIEIEQEGKVDFTQFVDPFPGLRPFGVEESHLFFGREGQSDEVLMKLSDNKFVGILGASGSGKSSLMYCGLIPTLYGGFMTQAGSNWRIIVTRPGGGPIDNLAEALLVKDRVYNDLDDEEQLIRKIITSTVLRSSSLGLIEAVKQLKSTEQENVLILVDQFEELFRYKKSETLSSDLDESSAFVNLLLEAVHQYDAPIYIALTMRSDFIGDCATFPDLTQMINDSHYLIPQMTRDQKRLAIEGPVAVGGGKIAPRLTQQLLNDVGDNPDQLPILQHALMRTWQFWKEYKKEEEPMDIKHYNAIGTLREALSQHANEAYDSLSKREQQICEAMFKVLTERGTESSGIRRPTKLSTIASIAGVNEEEATRVVDKFREPGRTLLMPPHGVPIGSDTVVDISHESLMRIWTRLKSWLDEESRSAEMYLKLAESAERFQLGRAGLWKMPDLQLALNWEEENKPTLIWGQRYNPAFERAMIFLETSKKAHETEQRNKEFLQQRALKRSRVAAIFLGVAALVCIFLVVMSQIKSEEARKQTFLAISNLKLADKNAAKAKIEEKKAVEAAGNAIIQERKAQEQTKIAQEQTKIAQQALVQAEIEKKKAEASATEAERQSKIAQESAAEAERQSEIAKANAKEAELQTANALNLRLQSIANSMAIKSKSMKGDVERKALIARQAWLFDDEYGAKEYNADVYVGVYSAYKALLDLDSATKNFNHYVGHAEGEAIRSVVYAKDGKSLFSAGSDGKILSWDMRNSKKSYEILINNNLVDRVVDVSPNEKWLAVGGDDNRILLYNLAEKGSEPKELVGHKGSVFDLVFLQNNRGFIFVSGDHGIWLNDFYNSSKIASVTLKVKALALSPDGRYLAGGAESGSIYIWDLNNGNKQSSIYIKGGVAVHSLAFNSDGSEIAIGDEKGDIILWDMVESRRIKRLTGHDSKVTDLEFNADNSLLASTSFDGTARIWTRDHLNDFPITLDDHGKGKGSKNWVWSVAFAPDGQSLVTGAGDGIMRFWPTQASDMAAEICGNPHMEHNLSRDSWEAYVAPDIEYRETCEGKPEREDNL